MKQNSFREKILEYASEQYGTEPEYMWAISPNHAVLRHGDNRKWYGLIMDVPRCKLGIPGDGIVDILNIKCDPVLSGSLRMSEGFLPGYHMSKGHWISILLDGTVELKEILGLLDFSYGLTGVKKKKPDAHQ